MYIEHRDWDEMVNKTNTPAFTRLRFQQWRDNPQIRDIIQGHNRQLAHLYRNVGADYFTGGTVNVM